MKIFYRRKDQKGSFSEGWITKRERGLIFISPYNGASWGIWCREEELEIIERK